MNNYYDKKSEIQNQLRPLILKKFKESLKTVTEKNKDWLFSVPTALGTLNEDFIKNKDSFRFPDSIILFEAWMNLGLDAIFPRFVLHFKFPGFLKGEKVRHIFQFIYSTSRGFGFPINFGPEFYDYKLKFAKIFQPILKWTYTLCHKANQGIYLVGDKRLKSKRHHPGEFESVIISEYDNNIFKGIDTLLHGYFTNDPKYLGEFTSLEEALKNVIFSYTIGDHAMSVEKIEKYNSMRILKLPLISYDSIIKKYDVDFYSYIKRCFKVDKLLIRKINHYKRIRHTLIDNLKLIDKIKLRLEQSKKFSIPGQKLSAKFSEIQKYTHYKHLMENLRNILFTTPPYTHTVHIPTKKEEKFASKNKNYDDFEQDSSNSILLSFIKQYEKEQDFKFEEPEVIAELKLLRDDMAKMWLYFKERHFRYAVKKLNEITSLSLDDQNYEENIKISLEKLVPIISIYEIFNRPLSESVYPESIPQTQRFGAHLARFLTSKYNPIGFNIMDLFNKLAFNNWCHLIKKKKLSYKEYFNLIVRLPIWKHIPDKIKLKILSYYS